MHASFNHQRFTKIRFTVNNPVSSDVADLKNLESEVKYICYGKEVGESGTPHFQGYAELSAQHSGSWLSKRIPRAHILRADRSRRVNKVYCGKGNLMGKELYDAIIKKGGNPEEHELYGNLDFYEYIKEVEPSSSSSSSSQASSSDLYIAKDRDTEANYAGFIDIIDRCSKWREVIRNPELANHLARGGGLAFAKELWANRSFGQPESLTFFKWQKNVLDILRGPPHPRKIISIVGTKGGEGKSTFVKWLCQTKDAILFSGKDSDISFAYEGQRIVLFDIPRCQDNISWGTVEKVKNGHLFSGKYSSSMKLFAKPHVFLFSNKPVPFGTFSEDRLTEIFISESNMEIADDQRSNVWYEDAEELPPTRPTSPEGPTSYREEFLTVPSQLHRQNAFCEEITGSPEGMDSPNETTSPYDMEWPGAHEDELDQMLSQGLYSSRGKIDF